MMYPYITFNDETIVTHSQIFDFEGRDSLEVNFEKPIDDGFKVARARLPDYTWLKNEGYSEKEILFFTEFLHSNAHLFYRYAAEGGLKLA